MCLYYNNLADYGGFNVFDVFDFWYYRLLSEKSKAMFVLVHINVVVVAAAVVVVA